MVYISPNSRQEMERSLKDFESSFSSGNGAFKETTHLYLHIQVSAGLLTTACVRRYFSGLTIDDILFFKDKHHALVKFVHSDDAYEGIQRFKKNRNVTVFWSSLSEWKQHAKEYRRSFPSRHERKGHQSRSPERLSHSSFSISTTPPRYSRSPQRYSQSRRARSPPWHSRSPLSGSRSPRIHSRSPRIKSRSPRRSTGSPLNVSNVDDPIYDGDFHVHVTNLNYTTRKDELRRWFFNLVSDHQIKFLCNDKGHRTRECLVAFKNEKDYRKVLRLNESIFDGRRILISSISKSSIRNLLTDSKELLSHHFSKGKCLYLRNFPSDVTKSDILKFFAGFSLSEEDISLLSNRDGVGIGEVMVSLSSEEDLERAEKLHRKKFKDKEIPLRRIPEEKLQTFLSSNSLSLMPEDPYDCVTQEDDLLEEESDQEKDTSDKEDDIPQEDSSCHQTDNTHECVTQADDAPEESPTHVKVAPSTKCNSDENSRHVDNDEDDDEDDVIIPEDAVLEDAVLEDDVLEDDVLRQ